MTYRIVETLIARQDKQEIVDWLLTRSPAGALAWLDAYEKILERLRKAPHSFSQAPERKDLELDLRQALFKTSRGRFYRALFYINESNVVVLRVRAPGQAPVSPDEFS